jgi:DeoR family transcriptional regulator of aga operon
MKSARQAQIRQIIEERGSVVVSELGSLLGVSEATIRRDLDALAAESSIIRTHGGAMTATSHGRERPLLEREAVHREAKEAIAKKAASMVAARDTIFLGSGTTVSATTKHLALIPSLTIISNSLPVIEAVSNWPGVDLIVIGGAFRRSELSMVGLTAVESINQFRADRVFMGMRAIDVKHGFTGDAVDEAMTDRAILGMGRQSIVLADQSKFGCVSTAFLAPIDAADCVITDAGIDPRTADEVVSLGMQLVITGRDAAT